jgi:hypothetical protein
MKENKLLLIEFGGVEEDIQIIITSFKGCWKKSYICI